MKTAELLSSVFLSVKLSKEKNIIKGSQVSPLAKPDMEGATDCKHMALIRLNR